MSGDFTFLKGNIETIILCSLYNGNKYGYEIAKEIKERTNNRYEIKQPTLYSYLKRLEEDDLIGSYWGENSNGGRRRYYSLTKTGRENCEQFISEWQYQRSVLSELVDGTANVGEITQEEATPLFGRKVPRRPRKETYKAELDEQDEISRRLREIAGVSDEQEEKVETVVEPTEVAEEQTTSEPTVIERIVFVERTEESTNEQESAIEETVTDSEQDTKSRFEVNQDNAEDFMQVFDERAREVSERQVGASEGENYQHVLMGVLGDQLDSMEQLDDSDTSPTYYNENHVALEDVADSIAKEGIRLRIYNHATATYKSKTLIPQAKVLCQTSWFTYAFALIYFGVFTLTSISYGKWPLLTFVITLAVLLLVPLGLTIYAIVDPTRKEKPIFNYKLALIVVGVLAVIIVLLAIAISALTKTEFGNYTAVSQQILIPTGIAILLPIGVVIYDLLYKQY